MKLMKLRIKGREIEIPDEVQLVPLAAESLGVRSLATYVKTPDIGILIDPGVAIAPERYGLPPAPEEFQALEEARKRIQEYSHKADVIIISHYHYDHHTPFLEDIYCAAKPEYARELYKDKILLIKDPEHDINKSQFSRAQHFLLNVKDLAKRIEYCDNSEFRFGDTIVRCSPAVWHGQENSKLGYVVMSLIDYHGYRILHASDVQGPIVESTVDWIIQQHPNIIIMGGPPTHFLGWRFSKKNLQRVINNVKRILEEANPDLIIYEHHHLRDLKYLERLKEIYEDPRIVTAAEFLQKENRFLEAHRKELHEKAKEKT
jgi:predicted metallo-beta-lactamase superfamily hydrolase